MSPYEYRQLVKFLYFEGYAESYQEAEYLLEEMNDNDFGYLYEEVIVSQKIINHLIAEGYADTNENALVIMANMSEEWRRSIVEGREEMIAANIARPRIGGTSQAAQAAKAANRPNPLGKVSPIVKNSPADLRTQASSAANRPNPLGKVSPTSSRAPMRDEPLW